MQSEAFLNELIINKSIIKLLILSLLLIHSRGTSLENLYLNIL